MIPIDNWRTLDNYGNVMPWYTRPCLAWLIDLDLRFKRVFEYGGGVSTNWYRLRGAIVSGVDSNPDWANGLRVESDKYKYLGAIGNERYDLIIIDGDFRDDCAYSAIEHLNPGAFLIADNFEQPSADLPDWPKTRELTKHLPLTLYKEPTHPDWQTAVWQNV